MKKNRGILVLIFTVLLTGLLCFTAAVGFGPTGTGAAKNIKTGLDLSGGVSITYEAKDENPSSEDMADTTYKLQKRVEQYSTEAPFWKNWENQVLSVLWSRRTKTEKKTSHMEKMDMSFQEPSTRFVKPVLLYWKVQI